MPDVLRIALGVAMIASVFVAITVAIAQQDGWRVVAIVWGGTVLMMAVILGGVVLIFGGWS